MQPKQGLQSQLKLCLVKHRGQLTRYLLFHKATRCRLHSLSQRTSCKAARLERSSMLGKQQSALGSIYN